MQMWCISYPFLFAFAGVVTSRMVGRRIFCICYLTLKASSPKIVCLGALCFSDFIYRFLSVNFATCKFHLHSPFSFFFSIDNVYYVTLTYVCSYPINYMYYSNQVACVFSLVHHDRLARILVIIAAYYK
jgi:hypothetical protein